MSESAIKDADFAAYLGSESEEGSGDDDAEAIRERCVLWDAWHQYHCMGMGLNGHFTWDQRPGKG